jgi:hypothetical protein
VNLDLFGDPIPEHWGRRGRPPHVPSVDNRNKVKMLLALGWTDERIANSLSISQPTLRKHYFLELKFRDEARDRLEARYAMLVWQGVEALSGAAFKEFRRIVDHGDAVNADKKVRHRATDGPRPQKLGKKEERQLAAHQVGGKFTTPSAPTLIVHNK